MLRSRNVDGKWRTKMVLTAVMFAGGLSLVGSNLAAAPAEAIGIHYSYYENYFKSAETCKARGKQLMKEVSSYVSFTCHKKKNHSKWSMDIYYDNGVGCIIAPASARSETLSAAPACGGRA